MRKFHFVSVLVLIFTLSLFVASSAFSKTEKASSSQGLTAIMTTSKGVIRLKLYDKQTPNE